jgi:hypothetical protein
MSRRERDRLLSDKEFDENLRKEMEVSGGLTIKEVKLTKPNPKLTHDDFMLILSTNYPN